MSRPVRTRRLAALVAIALLGLWGALVLLRTETAPVEPGAPIRAPVAVEHPTVELPTPSPSRPAIEPLVPVVVEGRVSAGMELLPAAGLSPVAAGACALEFVILLPDGRVADSRLWGVTIRAETPLFAGGSNLRRILMLDAARGSYVVTDLRPDLSTWVEVDDDLGRSLRKALVPGLPPGQARRVELRLSEFPTELHVLVTDESGSPLAGAAVAFGQTLSFDPPRWEQVDDKGRLSRTVSAAGDGIALRVRHAGYASRTLGNVAITGRSMTLRVTLEPERVVRVFLCDGSGAPLAADSVGARIGIQYVDGIRLTEEGPGWWELRELPEGTVTLRAGYFGDDFTQLHDTEKPEARFEVASCGTLIVHWDSTPGQQPAVYGVFVQRKSAQRSSGRIMDWPSSPSGTRSSALPPGNYEVSLLDASRDPIGSPVHAEIRVGQITEVTLSP